MFDFDSVFRPTDEERHKQKEFVNSFIRRSIEEDGECCKNCKHTEGVNVGHGWMEYRCKKTRKCIDEDIKCEHYKFCGFIGDNYGR